MTPEAHVPGHADPAVLGGPERAESRGGVLVVEARSSGHVTLRSERYHCDGCVRRAHELLVGQPGIVRIDEVGVGRLDVWYDATVSSVDAVGDLARRALEADPHNPAPVALCYPRAR